MFKNILKLLFTFFLIVGLFLILTKTNLITLFNDNKVEAIMVNQTEMGLKLNSTYQLKAYVYPQNAINSELVWTSSDDKIVEVNYDTGYIIGKSIGTATITALNINTNLKVEIVVHVDDSDITVTNATFVEDEINLLVDNSYNLNYTIEPSNYNCHNIKIISSDSNVLEINDYSVKALRKGSCIVSILNYNGDTLDTLKVNVYNEESEISYGDKEILIKDLILSTYNVNLVIGGNIKIKTSVLPNNANQKVNYYVIDNSICYIENNIIYGKKIGNTKIIVSTINGISKIIDVTVTDKKVKVEKIESDTEITLNLGTQKDIDTKIYPSNATNQSLSYYSSDENVVKVTSTGTLTPVRLGSAIITVISTDGGYRNLINVYVTDKEKIVYETSVELSSDTYHVNINETLSINPTIYPINASNKNYDLVSLNTNICSIENGLIKGINKGTCNVKLTTKNSKLTKNFKVIVDKVLVEDIVLSKNKITIKEGETSYINYLIYPENASNKNISWNIDDSDICILNEGIVYGIKSGKTIITAKIDNVVKKIIVEVVE